MTGGRIFLPPGSAKATSGATGEFNLTGLVAGEYRICVLSLSGEYLDPCWWKDPFATLPVEAKAGQVKRGLRIQVEPGTYRFCVIDAGSYLDPCQWNPDQTYRLGSTLNQVVIDVQRGIEAIVRVVDRENLVRSVAGDRPSPIAARIVDQNGRSRLVPLGRTGDRSFEYSLYVPVGTNLTLELASGRFLLADSADKAIDERGHLVPLLAQRPVASSRPHLPGSIFTGSQAPAVLVEVKIRGTVAGR